MADDKDTRGMFGKLDSFLSQSEDLRNEAPEVAMPPWEEDAPQQGAHWYLTVYTKPDGSKGLKVVIAHEVGGDGNVTPREGE